jgi:hypothetical protein
MISPQVPILFSSGLMKRLRLAIGSFCAFVLQGGPVLACQICDEVNWHTVSLPMRYELPVCLERSRKWVAQAGFNSEVSSGYLNPMDGYVLATKIHPFGNLRVEVECMPSSQKASVTVSGLNNDFALQELKALMASP